MAKITPAMRAAMFSLEQNILGRHYYFRDCYCSTRRLEIERKIKEGISINNLPRKCDSCGLYCDQCIFHPNFEIKTDELKDFKTG